MSRNSTAVDTKPQPAAEDIMKVNTKIKRSNSTRREVASNTVHILEIGALAYIERLRGKTWDEMEESMGWGRRHLVNAYNAFRETTGAAVVENCADDHRGGYPPAVYVRPVIVKTDGVRAVAEK